MAGDIVHSAQSRLETLLAKSHRYRGTVTQLDKIDAPDSKTGNEEVRRVRS